MWCVASTGPGNSLLGSLSPLDTLLEPQGVMVHLTSILLPAGACLLLKSDLFQTSSFHSSQSGVLQPVVGKREVLAGMLSLCMYHLPGIFSVGFLFGGIED